MFDINFVRSCNNLGKITIGEHEEHFESVFTYWSKNKYTVSWIENCQYILNGAHKAMLVTLIGDPKISNFFRWWAMYREKDSIFIQEHFYFLDDDKKIKDFNEDNLNLYIDDRCQYTEDGDEISEWNIGLQDIANYIDRTKA